MFLQRGQVVQAPSLYASPSCVAGTAARAIAALAAMTPLLLVLLPACSVPRSAPGPFRVEVEQGKRGTATGDSVAYALYLPVPSERQPNPPYAAVILTHGFSRSYRVNEGNARYLAERGIVVLTPNMSSLLAGRSAQERNARNTADHVAWLARRSVTHGDRVHGMVDPTRIGLAGHSAGGAVSFQAAVLSQAGPYPVAALCLLDAVPWHATLQAAPNLKPIPACSLRAEPSAFNAWDSGQKLVDAVTFPIHDIRIRGASHVDPENPSTTAAGIVVGLSAERQAIFTRLMYLFFQDALQVRSVERPATNFQAMLAELGMARISVGRASPDTSPR